MPEKKKQTRKVKVVLGSLLGLFVLLIVFYQPILFGLVRIVAGQVAKSQAIDLDFEIHGSLFTDLFIEKLHLQPRPENKTLPLERVDAQRLGARYNLLNLFRKKYLDVVDLLELKNIDIIVRPAPPAPQQKPAAPLRLPVVLPKQIDAQNINCTVKNEGGDLQLKNFELQFQQGQTGYLACETVRIPSLAVWNQLRAKLSYTRNELVVSDFALNPLLVINRLGLDLSGSEQGTFRLNLDAKALGSSILANASYDQPEAGRMLDADLKVSHLELPELQRLAPVALTGSVPEIDVQLRGDINHPRSLSGQIKIAAEGVRHQNIGFDNGNVALTINNGSGTIVESINAGPNKMRAHATFTLSENWDDLVEKTVAHIGLAASIPDPGREIPGLKASATILGSIGLADGEAKAVLRTLASKISTADSLPGAAVSAANADVFAVARLPLAEDIWKSVAAVAIANADKISYQDAHIAEVRADTDLIDGATGNGKLAVRSGESRIDLSANTPLPTSSAGFDPKNVRGRLKFNVNSITDFITQEVIKGSLSADGDVQIAAGQANGMIRAAGDRLKYRGMNLESLNVDTVLKDGDANIQKCQIDIDPDNSIQMTGSARLNEPFPFHADGKLAFKDVAVLNALLQNIGAQPGISGELNAQFSGDGDIHRPSGRLQVTGNDLKYRGFVVQNVDIGAAIKESTATLQRCRISLDPNNYLNINGTAHVIEPYPYEARAQIRLPDLGRLNELLKGLGQPSGVSGSFSLDAGASGDAKNPTASLQAQADQIKYQGLLISTVRSEAAVRDMEAKVETCRVVFDANNYVDLTGAFRIADPFPYEANATIA